MPYHLTAIPENSGKIDPDFKGRFFIAAEFESGEVSCVSDEEPQDDVRGWMSLRTARSIAEQRKKIHWPQSCIIQVTPKGWVKHPLVLEVEFASYADGGSW